jgi:hypothetical protein
MKSCPASRIGVSATVMIRHVHGAAAEGCGAPGLDKLTCRVKPADKPELHHFLSRLAVLHEPGACEDDHRE